MPLNRFQKGNSSFSLSLKRILFHVKNEVLTEGKISMLFDKT